MKNKKAIIIVTILIVIVLIIGIVIAAIKKHNMEEDNEKGKMPTKFSISYSYGGGFTTYADSLHREITIDQDGNVTIELTIDDSKVEPLKYNIGKDKAKELMEFFYENEFYSVKKDLSNNDVTDLDSRYIEVKSNTFNRRVGGYAASLNNRFRKFSSKIVDTVGEEKIKEFRDSVIKAYEKE